MCIRDRANTTPKMMPVTRATMIAGPNPAVGLNRLSSTPTNRPNQAPDSPPVVSTRPQDSRPVTRSTSIRSTPTMVTSSTGKSLSARWSTARWASS